MPRGEVTGSGSDGPAVLSRRRDTATLEDQGTESMHGRQDHSRTGRQADSRFLQVATNLTGPCLYNHSDYKAPHTRTLLEIVQKPVGLWRMDWASAELMTDIAQIIIEEVIGYKTTIGYGKTASGTILYAVGGCTDPNNYASASSMGCDLESTKKYHIGLELWGLTYQNEAKSVIRPADFPLDLGDLGYTGIEGLYVSRAESSHAYSTAGLDLLIYTSYNISWHTPWVSFDNYSVINESYLSKLSETPLRLSGDAEIYLSLTGDTGGVTTDQAGAALSMKVWNEYWWLSPACRATPMTCIPVLTMSGWGLRDFAQQSAVFNMPLALANVQNGTLWENMVRNHKVLFYWYQPDSAVVDLQPTIVALPPYDEYARSQGIRTSMGNDKRLSKWAWNELQDNSGVVYSFIQNLQLNLQTLEEIIRLRMSNSQLTSQQVACMWLRDNLERVNSWVPDPRDCAPGEGMVNASNDFVSNFSLATACQRCVPGKFSIRNTGGSNARSRKCVECAAGRYTNFHGAKTCTACIVGWYAQETRQSECQACEIGSYADQQGSHNCTQCPSGFATPFEGAKTFDNCICPKDTYFAPQMSCVKCGSGLTCPGDDHERGDGKPELKQGHMLYPPLVTMDPMPKDLQTYMCSSKMKYCSATPNLTSLEAMCQTRVGIACAGCPDGSHSVKDKCLPCASNAAAQISLFCCLMPFLCLWLYLKMNQDNHNGTDPTLVSSSSFMSFIWMDGCDSTRVSQSDKGCDSMSVSQSISKAGISSKEASKQRISTCSVVERPCPGGCGYLVTWHPSHCCGKCAMGLGHSDTCDKEKALSLESKDMVAVMVHEDEERALQRKASRINRERRRSEPNVQKEPPRDSPASPEKSLDDSPANPQRIESRRRLSQVGSNAEEDDEENPYIPTAWDRAVEWMDKFKNEVYVVSRDTFGMLFAFVQILGLLRNIYPGSGPNMVKFIMSIGSVLNVQMSIFTSFLDDNLNFKTGCLAGSSMPHQYAFALLLPLAPPFFFFLNFAVFTFMVHPRLHAYSKTQRDRKVTAEKPGCCMRFVYWLADLGISFDKTLNCIGMQVTSLFIGLTASSLALFVTYQHPGRDESSVRRYPDVLQYSDEWWTVVPMAIGGCLLYCFTVVTICIWVVYRAPRYAHLTNFRARYFFILDGYRPEVWWWGVVLLFRGLTINLVLVFVQSEKFSCMCLAVIFAFFLCMKFKFSPWPKTPMNITDNCTAFSLCVLIPAFAMRIAAVESSEALTDSVDPDTEYDGAYRVIEGVAVMLPFIATGLSACVPMILFARRRELVVKTMRDAKRLRYVMMLISRTTTQALTEMFLNFTDHDHQVVSDFVQLFCAELMHQQASAFLPRQRLIFDATDFEVIDDSKLMRQIEKESVVEEKDDIDLINEIGLVQFVFDQLILGYKERFMNNIMPPTRQQAFVFDKTGLNKNNARVTGAHVFAALDFNGDGVITKDEFVSRAMHLAPLVMEDEARKCFDALDWDKSHCLTSEEFDMGFKGVALDPQDTSPAVVQELASQRRVAMRWQMRRDQESHNDMQHRYGRRAKALFSVRRLQQWYHRHAKHKIPEIRRRRSYYGDISPRVTDADQSSDRGEETPLEPSPRIASSSSIPRGSPRGDGTDGSQQLPTVRAIQSPRTDDSEDTREIEC